MGQFGGYYKGEKKKLKKSVLEKKAQRELSSTTWQMRSVEIIKKGKSSGEK